MLEKDFYRSDAMRRFESVEHGLILNAAVRTVSLMAEVTVGIQALLNMEHPLKIIGLFAVVHLAVDRFTKMLAKGNERQLATLLETIEATREKIGYRSMQEIILQHPYVKGQMEDVEDEEFYHR